MLYDTPIMLTEREPDAVQLEVSARDGREGYSRAAVTLVLGAGYLSVITGVLVLAREVLRWGLVVSPGARTEVDAAIVLHAVGAGVAAAVYAIVRFARLDSPILARFLLALMPLVLFASIDRLIGIPFPRIAPPTGMSLPHPARGWSSRPGWTGTDGAASMRINALGLRGPEIPIPRPAGEFVLVDCADRITVLTGAEM